jgi:DNA primase
MIKPEVIDKVREAANIVEVVGDFVHLKPSGQNFKGLSPFVEERKPSFFVSPSKNIFKCFKSDIGGDAVKFLIEKERFTFIEAIRYLAEKYNIDLEEEVVTKVVIQDKKLLELPSLLVELEYLSSQLENLDSSKVSNEIEEVKRKILYLKDQKFKLVRQLSDTTFLFMREALEKANSEYKKVKKDYDEADLNQKKAIAKTLTVKLNRTKEIRGVIAFKHLLE